jgi:hypothetical protein
MLAQVSTVHPHAGMVDTARHHLQLVLASAPFARSRRHCKLLSYLLEEALRNPGATSKEMVIAVEVFGREAAEYDARLDPIVRIEAGRLRQRLRDYYAGEGADATVRFDVPRGGYALKLSLRPSTAMLDVSARNAVAGRISEIHTLRLAANQD